MKEPDAGTLFNQLYLLDRQFGEEFLTGLAAQHPVLLPANGVVDAVASGAVRVGASVDHWRVYTPAAMDAGIVPVYPHEGMPLVIASVAILAAAPHPNAAKLFLDFLLSQEGQQLLNTDILQTYSLRPDVPVPADQPPLADTKPLLPTDFDDYVAASEKFEQRFRSLFR